MTIKGNLVASRALCKKSKLYRLDQRKSRVFLVITLLAITLSATRDSISNWYRKYGYINYRYIRKS
jgi:hypothetical protein